MATGYVYTERFRFVQAESPIIFYNRNLSFISERLHGKIKLMKYIESGDSIPLSRRFDETSIQIKIIDDDIF